MAACGQKESDQTKASAAYLVTDESCRARIRGRHVSALFFPIAPTQVKRGGKKRIGGTTSSRQPPDYRRERKGGAQPKCFTMLHCLNSHFLYKIDALTAALERTHPELQ